MDAVSTLRLSSTLEMHLATFVWNDKEIELSASGEGDP